MAHGLYTVQKRDLAQGLLGIARRYYGDPWIWPTIYEANPAVIGDKSTLLSAGQQLVLPNLIPEEHGPIRSCLYRVDLHDLADGLTGVARRLWGDRERWRELYELNRGTIGDDPERLAPGQWLLLPEPR